MLNVFREGAKTWASRFLIYFVAATFVGAAFLVWGRGEAQRAEVAAVVAGEEIHKGRFEESVRRVEETIRRQFQDQLSPAMLAAINTRAMAMNSLVENVLQLREAKRAGVAVTDRELADVIGAMPDFQRGGVFSRAVYIDALGRGGVPPRRFEENLREDLALAKLRDMIQGAVTVSGAEVLNQYLRDYQAVNVEYVTVPAEKFAPKAGIADDELGEWFEPRKSEFETPEKRTFRTLTARVSSFLGSARATDEEMESYYRDHLSEFARQDKVHARHILVKIPSYASDEEVAGARKKIDEAARRLDAGENFGKVAEDVSEDPSAPLGGDLGSFGRGVMVPAFEEAVFSLKPGEISKPFRTEFGWHIAQAVSRSGAGTPPFEEVREEAGEKVKRQKARAMARELAEKAAQGLTAESLDKAAEDNPDMKLESHAIAKGEPILSFGGAKPLGEAVFALEPQSVSGVIELAEGFVIAAVDSVEKAHVPPLDEIRDRVEKSFRLEKSIKMAAEAAERIARKVNDGAALAEAAGEEGLKAGTAAPFSRAMLADPVAVRGEGMTEEAFSLKEGEAKAAPAQGGYMVIRLVSREPVDEKHMEKKLADIRETLLLNKKSKVYTDYLASLRKAAEKNGEITINVDLGQAKL